MSAPKKLLIQACCGPCAIAALERFAGDYDITLFFWGSNLDNAEEFRRRSEALNIVNKELNGGRYLAEVPYSHEEFLTAVAGLENEREGGRRCEVCFGLRMRAAARYAKGNGYDAFTTSLTVSPHKSGTVINRIGREIGAEVCIPFIAVDLSENDGFRRSVAVGKRLGIYRQNYCGCKF